MPSLRGWRWRRRSRRARPWRRPQRLSRPDRRRRSRPHPRPGRRARTRGNGPLSSVFATVGIWNSLHGGPTGADGRLSESPKSWYEVDVYGKLGVTLFEDFTAAFVYTASISPNDRFKTVEEVGLSLDDYYEFGTGRDETVGYFSGGVTAAVPLEFIPASFGSWTAKAGVQFLKLGDNLERINHRDSFEVIGTFGLAFTY